MVHDSKPRHTTIGDLVQKCPGCNGTVSWPYTQDPFRELGKKYPTRYPATVLEKSLIGVAIGAHIGDAYSIGAIIRTIRTRTGVLWHEPCYVSMYTQRWHSEMQKLVDIIQRQIDRKD